MSTRYVWEKYVAKVEEERVSIVSIISKKEDFPLYAYESYEINKRASGVPCFSPYGNRSIVGANSFGLAKNFRYLFTSETPTTIYENPGPLEDADAWYPVTGDYPSFSDENKRTVYLSAVRGPENVKENHKRYNNVSLKISAGSKIGYKSNSSKTYPNDGAYGEDWYKYLGSDSIDPSTVTYSKQDLYSGEPVIIEVTPITPTYGGTISYLYQYSTDGGNTWTNIGSKTTETSKTFTIPEEVEQFQARVQASDGWGFTSATYVTGANLPVSQIKAYATVDGKLMAGAKMYATVDRKIRQVQKGYATVGGKIRKMF